VEGVPESRVGPQQPHAADAGTGNAGDQLIGESQHALLCVCRPSAQADVQYLSGVGAGGEDRVIPEQLGVPVGRALLQPAAHLADEAVYIDHQPPVARTGASPPRAPAVPRAACRAGAPARRRTRAETFPAPRVPASSHRATVASCLPGGSRSHRRCPRRAAPRWPVAQLAVRPAAIRQRAGRSRSPRRRARTGRTRWLPRTARQWRRQSFRRSSAVASM